MNSIQQTIFRSWLQHRHRSHNKIKITYICHNPCPNVQRQVTKKERHWRKTVNAILVDYALFSSTFRGTEFFSAKLVSKSNWTYPARGEGGQGTIHSGVRTLLSAGYMLKGGATVSMKRKENTGWSFLSVAERKVRSQTIAANKFT